MHGATYTVTHHCTVVHGILVYELFNEELADLPVILDSFHQYHEYLHK